MQKLEGRTFNVVQDNIEKLKELFPEVFTENKVDIDKLRLALGEHVEIEKERYEFTWNGKTEAIQLAQKQTTGTLRPSKEDSVNWDKTQNLYVEGDNLEVLRILQSTYRNKVKMIFIDPPYNRGDDLIYKDDYQDNIKSYKEKMDDHMKSNPETNGRYHTEWLNLMYPRLKLAKNLLKNNGVICVAISDVESANLKKLLDEIFFEENYINTISLKSKVNAGASGGGEDKRLKKNIENIYIYCKDIRSINPLSNLYQNYNLMTLINEMRNENQSWKYTSVLVDKGKKEKLMTIEDGEGNPIEISLLKNIKRKSIKDIMKEENLEEEEVYKKYLDQIFSDTNAQSSIRTRIMDAAGNLLEGTMYEVEYIPRSGKMKGKKVTHHYISNTVRRVIWLNDVVENVDGILYKKERLSTLWDDIEFNNVGKEGEVPFPNGKKPISLIDRCISIDDDPNGIILDFFSGSASTAHAVINRNIMDNGSRRFIMVQIPEKLDGSDKQQKVAFDFLQSINKETNICEIGKERIRRSGKKILEDNRDQEVIENLDIGFKVFKLDETSLKIWDEESMNLEKELLDFVEPIKEGRTQEDVVYEILLKYGIDLTLPIEETIIAEKTVYSVGLGYLLICLERDLTINQIEEMAKQQPARIVFYDEGFKDDTVRTNAQQILKRYGVEDIRVI